MEQEDFYDQIPSPAGRPRHDRDHPDAGMAHHRGAGDADRRTIYRHRHGRRTGHPCHRRRGRHRHGGLAGAQHHVRSGHRIFVLYRPCLRRKGSGKRPQSLGTGRFCDADGRRAGYADAPLPVGRHPRVDAGGRKHPGAGRLLFLHSVSAHAAPGGHLHFRHPFAGGG